MALLMPCLDGWQTATGGWAKVGLFWRLVLVMSTLLYTFFEKPVTELRERLSAKEPTPLQDEKLSSTLSGTATSG